MRALFLLATPLLALAMLPPGYEERLFCMPPMCLKHRDVKPGVTGQRTMFYECCDQRTGAAGRPRAWGVRVGDDYLQSLLSAGWRESPCANMDEPCGQPNRTQLIRRIESFVDAKLMYIDAIRSRVIK